MGMYCIKFIEIQVSFIFIKNCDHEFRRDVNHLNLVCKNYMSNNVSDHAKSIRGDEDNYDLKFSNTCYI